VRSQNRHLLALFSIVSLAWASAANAATLTVAWDASAGQDVAGYILYWGTQSGGQNQSFDVGNQLSAQVTGLSNGTRYYLVVRAYSSTGALSGPSTEASGVTATGVAPLPSISCPVVTGSSSDGKPVAVNFSPTVTGGAAPVTATCSPASGTMFPIGNSPFTCTVTDSLLRTASCSSVVVVSAPPSPTGTSPTGNPSILVTPTTVGPGGAVTVSWDGMLPSAATDWFGLYRSAASDTAFSSWLYVSCSQQATAGKASGSCTMTVPASSTSGSYNVRLFRNDGYQRSATSSELTVSTLSPPSPTPLPGPSMQVTPITVRRDGTVTVSWSGLVAPTAKDWFGLYQSTASDQAYLGWLYVNCTQVPSTPRASGSCSITLPQLAAGSYSLRLFSNDGYQRLASSPLTVTKK
jgi:uncharacterized protein YodC (DUF2158 family)